MGSSLRRHATAFVGLGLLAFVATSTGCGRDASDGRRNVLLISIDSLRRDRLGCYGHHPEFAPDQAVSPHIDELASRGVVFDSAWTSSSWTLPAHMSLLTGLSAAGHGVESDDLRLDPLRETLAESFKNAGWATAGVYSGPYLHPRYGFDRGFERYESAMLSEAQIDELVARERARRASAGEPGVTDAEERVFRARVSNWDVTSSRVTAQAERFLVDHGDRPFFLFLHYFDVHYDHLPDAAVPGLAHAFDADYHGAFDGRNWYFDPRVRELDPPFTRRIGERDLHHVMALYDAEVQWVDHHVGRVLAALEKAGLADDTIVAVVSDHGDEFFEHDGIGHRNTLFAEVARIPLVLALPDGEHAGRRLPAPVRIHDLAPTLLDYAGAPSLRARDSASLRPLLAGTELAPRDVPSRLYDPAPWFVNVREAWRDARFTVIRHFDLAGEHAEQVRDAASGEPIFHVFDRDSDPDERAALRPSDPRYRDAVERYRRAWRAEQAFLAAQPRSPIEALRVTDSDPHQRAPLEALGYAAGAPDRTSSRSRLVLPPPGE
ncbi:MAG: sulfatase [Planctomycetes bacterium]|nr:sulfatase [Planctomycetota bacterium]